MYLEPWMLIILAFLFGFCAWWNRHRGIREGTINLLDFLLDKKIIRIGVNGDIKKYIDKRSNKYI